MKLALLISALLLGACTSTLPPTSIPSSPSTQQAATPAPATVAGSGYSFHEPANVKLINMRSEEQKGDMLIDDPNNLFILVKVGAVDAGIPFEVFAAVIGSALSNSGFAFSSVEPIIWLNNQGANFTGSRGNLLIYTWLGLANGTGVAFTCGGLTNDETRNAAWCREMAESFSLTATH